MGMTRPPALGKARLPLRLLYQTHLPRLLHRMEARLPRLAPSLRPPNRRATTRGKNLTTRASMRVRYIAMLTLNPKFPTTHKHHTLLPNPSAQHPIQVAVGRRPLPTHRASAPFAFPSSSSHCWTIPPHTPLLSLPLGMARRNPASSLQTPAPPTICSQRRVRLFHIDR